MSQPHPDRTADLFSESTGQTAEEYLAKSRLQVAFAITTGVLVIVITTAVVVVMGIKQTSVADSPNRPVGITSDIEIPIIPSLTPTPPASPEATPSPTATAAPGTTPTQTKKPPTSPPPTTSGPIIARLLSLSCEPASVIGGQGSTCTITLTGPAHANLSISLASDQPGVVSVPPSAAISVGQASQTFIANTDTLVAGESLVTATLAGESLSFTVKVTSL